MKASTLAFKRWPSFWNPANIRDPHYVPNLDLAIAEGRRLNLEPAQNQKNQDENRLLVLIDMEKDFQPGGRLGVPGMFEDIERLGERIIQGTLNQFYTDLIITVDTHPIYHRSAPIGWEDEQGNLPDASVPLFMILIDDNPADPIFEAINVLGVNLGKFRPTFMKGHAVDYWKHLQATKQGNGHIWVFAPHCQEGTEGKEINGALRELITWFGAARKIEPAFLFKGMIRQVDWFGPFRPCMDVPTHPQGSWQTNFLDKIKWSKTTEIAGEAEDFCVGTGVNQVLDYFEGEQDVLKTISFLGDCTSAIIPGSDVVQALHARMKSAGVRIITHDAPFDDA